MWGKGLFGRSGSGGGKEHWHVFQPSGPARTAARRRNRDGRTDSALEGGVGRGGSNTSSAHGDQLAVSSFSSSSSMLSERPAKLPRRPSASWCA